MIWTWFSLEEPLVWYGLHSSKLLDSLSVSVGQIDPHALGHPLKGESPYHRDILCMHICRHAEDVARADLAMASILVPGILTDLPGRWLAHCLSYPLRFFCVFFISSTSLFILVPVPQSESAACVNAQGRACHSHPHPHTFLHSARLHNSLYITIIFHPVNNLEWK